MKDSIVLIKNWTMFLKFWPFFLMLSKGITPKERKESTKEEEDESNLQFYLEQELRPPNESPPVTFPG